jgi:ribosomal protein S18 acetylase RimI-like enzyme
MTMKQDTLAFRNDVNDNDPRSVEEIVTSTGFFRPDEIPVAVELVRERLEKGPESGYEFIFAETDGRTVSYACFGQIPCTLHSYDLYWIATHNDYRSRGIGKRVLTGVEKAIAALGGKSIYVETSGLPRYEPTRAFYLANGYEEKARFVDFYADGDDKVVYVKKLS